MKTKIADRWLLPEGVEELLPPQAEHLEQLRRDILDLFHSWGYQLVIPPLMEYLESLLTGAGHDLDLQTFKITDQRTGRLMGVRADMTPQLARIDAHGLKNDSPNRLCYLGPVLQTNPTHFSASRNPFQIGAELFGHDGLESDVEIICLMMELLAQAGLDEVVVDLGHIGIFRGLIQQAGLDAEQEQQLFDILQRKAIPEIKDCLDGWDLDAQIKQMLTALIDLNGGKDTLTIAKEQLGNAREDVLQALADLQLIIDQVSQRVPKLQLHIDLAELRGFHYHTGVVFAAYLPGHGQAIARGGRYDEIGEVFGRARPATGFSTDLKSLVQAGQQVSSACESIIAPWSNDVDLADKVASLRAEGFRVINALPGHDDQFADKKLIEKNGSWVVE